MEDLQDCLSALETELKLKVGVICASHFTHLPLKVLTVMSMHPAGGRC